MTDESMDVKFGRLDERVESITQALPKLEAKVDDLHDKMIIVIDRLPAKGWQGEQGVQGVQGEQGTKGVQGEQGRPGILARIGVDWSDALKIGIMVGAIAVASWATKPTATDVDNAVKRNPEALKKAVRDIAAEAKP